ncbi:hypothetical protein [Clavibacter tessellarius]|uniref:hypothetical protein n=1 Tax=Clavibacter tessellarius TaxID=31965 RepID=UPI00324CB52C
MMNCRSQKMPNAFAAAGTMSACSWPTQPRLIIVTNCGITDSCAGSMKVTSSSANSARRPGNSYFANVNAAMESKNSTSTVTETATTIVFISEPPKSIVRNTAWTLSHRYGPGTSTGGDL